MSLSIRYFYCRKLVPDSLWRSVTRARLKEYDYMPAAWAAWQENILPGFLLTLTEKVKGVDRLRGWSFVYYYAGVTENTAQFSVFIPAQHRGHRYAAKLRYECARLLATFRPSLKILRGLRHSPEAEIFYGDRAADIIAGIVSRGDPLRELRFEYAADPVLSELL